MTRRTLGRRKGPMRALLTAALLALALGGCSTLKLGYGQAEWLGYWWLDRYVDFDDAQTPAVRAALAQWLAWHRQAALAEDAALLEQAAGEALRDAGEAQACGWIETLERRRDLYLTQAAPAVATIGARLSAAQRTHLAQRFERLNQEWREEQLPADPQARERAAAERVIERAEMLYGRLDRAQRDFVAERSRASPWDAQRWLGERQTDQREMLALLERLAAAEGSGARPATAAAPPDKARTDATRETLLRIVRPSSDAMQRYRSELFRHQCRFAAELHNRTTPAQRAQAAETLRGWARDLRSFTPVAARGAARHALATAGE